MNELVRRCGGSKATLYGYFPSKEALFMAVVKEVATGHMPEAADEIRERNEKASLEEQLIRFGVECFHAQEVSKRPLLLRGNGLAQRNGLGLGAGQGISNSITLEAKVIPGFALKGDLLQG